MRLPMLLCVTISLLLFQALAVTSPSPAQQTQSADSDRFYVLGEVVKPGDFELKADTTVRSAMDTVGGITARADIGRAVLLRGEEKIPLDIRAILDGKIPDVQLKSGDTILVKPGTCRVEGKVTKAGIYDIPLNLTPVDALKMAGGAVEGADPEAAYITRGDKTILIDLTDVAKMSAEAKLLQAGDVLTVPERTVTVTGQVARPGVYALIPGKTDKLQDAIAAAGGTIKKANLKKTQVTLTQKDGASVTKVVDASGGSKPEDSPVLHRGDSVYVPESGKKKRVDGSDIYQGIIILYTLLSVF